MAITAASEIAAPTIIVVVIPTGAPGIRRDRNDEDALALSLGDPVGAGSSLSIGASADVMPAIFATRRGNANFLPGFVEPHTAAAVVSSCRC
jgi:hypothetical protein